jgi:hypothetical protein
MKYTTKVTPNKDNILNKKCCLYSKLPLLCIECIIIEVDKISYEELDNQIY